MDDAIATYITNEEAKIKALRDAADSREADLAPVKAAYEKVRASNRPDVIDLNELVRDVSSAAGAAEPVRHTSQPVERQALPQNAVDLKRDWPAPPVNPFETPSQQKRQVHKKGEVRAVILRTLASGADKHINEVRSGVAEQGYKSLSYNHVRTELWTMKGEGLTSSPEKGLYRITGKGLGFLQSQKGESPVAAGLSGATKSETDDLA